MEEYKVYFDLAQHYGTGMALVLIPFVWELWRVHKSDAERQRTEGLSNAKILSDLTQAITRLPVEWQSSHERLVEKMEDATNQLKEAMRRPNS